MLLVPVFEGLEHRTYSELRLGGGAIKKPHLIAILADTLEFL